MKRLSSLKENKIDKLKKFKVLCKELDSALKRETQAELLLHKQNAQLQEMSEKFAQLSEAYLEVFKMKQVCCRKFGG